MRAVVCRAWGAVEDLRVEDVAPPTPGTGEVLIEVKATAVEIGKAMGARVIAGASTPERLGVARDHGADDLVNYTTENLTDRVLALLTDRRAHGKVVVVPGEASGCGTASSARAIVASSSPEPATAPSAPART